ncbi:N-acetylmuramoyl-L-alanine amidase [Vaginella massiliensis]|uniref:N-acetylmuramoyl-L-alanine amidase family protein n=1 Tax=Vaginella massiliensis TaxID=1816680 RepID=UPI0037525460
MINIQKYLFLLLFVLASSLFAQKNFVVVLDAGHGGHDAGARGVADLEKNIALDVTLRLGKMIEKEFKDVKVVYTRTTDVFIELHERTRISNSNRANLFISIHCNSATNRSAYGTETFVMGLNRMNETDEVSRRENSVIFLEGNQEIYQRFDPTDPEAVIAFEIQNAAYKDQSIRFADLVEKNFVRNNRYSRGVKQSNFHVLRGNASPSVLIELGFISNSEESYYLASDTGKKEQSTAIFKAFKTFKEEFDRKMGRSGKQTVETEKPKEVEKPVEGKNFKIHFLTSKNKFAPSSPMLKGLTDVEIVQKGSEYLYYYGNTNLISERDNLLAFVKRKGFPDAQWVEIGNNQKLEGKLNYRVQFMTSNKRYRDKDNKFNGLQNVVRIKERSLYKYYFGEAKSMEAAQKILEEVQKRGFRNAFIVTFDQDKPL